MALDLYSSRQRIKDNGNALERRSLYCDHVAHPLMLRQPVRQAPTTGDHVAKLAGAFRGSFRPANHQAAVQAGSQTIRAVYAMSVAKKGCGLKCQ